MQGSSSQPPPLANCAMHALGSSQGSVVYIFGGMTATGEVSNALYGFSLHAAEWHRWTEAGNHNGRYLHTMAGVGGKLIIFGGYEVTPPEASCGVINFGAENSEGLWNDNACSSAFGAVCQRALNQSLVLEAGSASACPTVLLSGNLQSGVPALGHYELLEWDENGRPVYQKIQTALGDGEVYLFSFAGGQWVVGPSRSLVLEPTDSQRSYLYVDSTADFPQQVDTQWNELLTSTQGETTWTPNSNLSLSCAIGVECEGNLMNDYCWTFLGDQISYAQAVVACTSWGGWLATVSSSEENSLVSLLTGGSPAWIGLTKGSSGHWTWQAGTELTYQNWMVHEPDGRGWTDPTLNSQSRDTGLLFDPEEDVWRSMGFQCGTPGLGLVSRAAVSVGDRFITFGGMDESARFYSDLIELEPLLPQDLLADDPELTDLTPESGLFPGQVLTFTGANLCRDDLGIIIGSSRCTEAVFQSATTGTCIVPSGFGTDIDVRVTQNNTIFETSTPVAFNYMAPVVQTINPGMSDPRGGERITITGRGFGPLEAPRNVTVGDSPCANIEWISDLVISCETPPAKAGVVRVALHVTVGDHFNAAEFTLFYIDPLPVATSIQPSMGPAAGGTSITVEGENFDWVVDVTVGGFLCPLQGNVTRSHLVCVLSHGLGTQLKLVVTTITDKVYDLGDEVVYSIEQPTVSLLSPRVLSDFSRYPTNGAEIDIIGTNFGVISSQAKVHIGDTEAVSALWLGDSMIRCMYSAGIGIDLVIQVHVAEQDARIPASLNFDYDAPTISALTPSFGPADAEMLLTVAGRDLGEEGVQVVRLQAPGISVTATHFWESSSALNVFFPANMVPVSSVADKAVKIDVVIDVGSQLGFSTFFLVSSSRTLTMEINGGVEEFDELQFRKSVAAVAWDTQESIAVEAVHIVSVIPGNRRAGSGITVGLRLLAFPADPSKNEMGILRLESIIKQCCNANICTDTEQVCQADCSQSTGCAELGSLRIEALEWYPSGSQGGSASPPGQTPGATPRTSTANGGGSPGWMVPLVSVAGAVVMLVLLIFMFIRYERYNNQLEAEEDELDRLEEEDEGDDDDPKKGTDAMNPIVPPSPKSTQDLSSEDSQARGRHKNGSLSHHKRSGSSERSADNNGDKLGAGVVASTGFSEVSHLKRGKAGAKESDSRNSGDKGSSSSAPTDTDDTTPAALDAIEITEDQPSQSTPEEHKQSAPDDLRQEQEGGSKEEGTSPFIIPGLTTNLLQTINLALGPRTGASLYGPEDHDEEGISTSHDSGNTAPSLSLTNVKPPVPGRRTRPPSQKSDVVSEEDVGPSAIQISAMPTPQSMRETYLNLSASTPEAAQGMQETAHGEQDPR